MNLREIEVSVLDWIYVTQDPVGDCCGYCYELEDAISGSESGYVKNCWFLSRSPS